MQDPKDIAALADYPSVVTLPIQWGDQDAFGHVNNTVPIRWFESSRIAYLRRTPLETLDVGEGLGPILATITCNYRLQLLYPDTVHIGARVTHIGNSSMHIEHAAFSEAHGAIAVEGNSVVVVFDYATQKPVRVPDEVRASIEHLEGRSLVS